LGMFVGLVVVLARSQLRGHFGFALIVLAGGSVGAAAIIKPEGVDFNLLAPLWLACVMFTAIPLAATALTLVFAHRWRVWWWRDWRRTGIAMVPSSSAGRRRPLHCSLASVHSASSSSAMR
jgi:hypothetical protein